MKKAKAKGMKIGDPVTFYFWHEETLRSCPATVAEIWPLEDGPQALALDVDFPPEELATGSAPRQSHAVQRTRWPAAGEDESRDDSGTWSPLS